MKLRRKLAHFFDGIINILAFVAGCLAIGLMLLTCYMVIMRYIFRQPPGWIIEISEYMLVYLTFLGTAWLLRENGHPRVDIIYTSLPSLLKKGVDIFISTIGSASCFILSGLSAWVTWDNYQREICFSQTLSIPKWIILGVIPLGSLLLALQFLRKAQEAFQKTTEYLNGGKT